ncbi:MAG: chemotaxis response regulator protein-glutamate methylesterase [Anaerolineae bacterium]
MSRTVLGSLPRHGPVQDLSRDSSKGPVRVLVVDDSAFMRHTVAKYLEADPDITVVGSARDGLDALAKIPALKPDVVTLDVEMPRMDGLAALQRIMAECPTPVVMLSSLTQRGARTTIQALIRGAVDFVPKPAASINIRTVMDDLAVKVKTAAGVRLAGARERRRGGDKERGRYTSAPPHPCTPAPQHKGGLRLFHNGAPLIVIGASTGGPRALHQVLSDLPADLPAAVAVVQHMPPGFTRSLAQRLNETSPLIVQEATDGDRLSCGLALLAPGDFHLRFKGAKRVSLDHGARRNHVRPAVDVTMESAAERYGAAVIGVVLTGMGADGTQGAQQIKAAGGKVIAEDESTSTVYGMPRSVAEAGLVDRVAPLPEVAPALVELVALRRAQDES